MPLPETITLVIGVADSAGNSASATVALTLEPPALAIATPGSLPQAQVGKPYNVQLVATGGVPPYTFTVASGTLPPGLTLSAAGDLSGTPTGP